MYATPTGPLADACTRFFAEATSIEPTTAQTYPPHVTLTGFFHRTSPRADGVTAEVRELLADLGPVPDGAVTVEELRVEPGWIGLVITSPWLLDVVGRFVASHRLEGDDDPLRPKDWLHLSLAYGVDDLDPYRRLAATFPADAAAGWEVGLWERTTTGGWLRRTPSP